MDDAVGDDIQLHTSSMEWCRLGKLRPEYRRRVRLHWIESRGDANQPYINYVDVGLVIILVKE
jgi:hypothetical protein